MVPDVCRTRATSPGEGGWAGGGGDGLAVLGEGEVEAVTLEVEAADAGEGGDLLRVGGGHDDADAELLEREAQLLLAVAGVERGGGAGGGGGEEGSRHAGTVGEHEGDAFVGGDAGATQLTGEGIDGGAQLGVGGVATAGALHGDRVGGAGGEQLGDRRRRWHVSDPPWNGVARCRARRGGRACTAGRWACRPRRYRPRGGG